MRPAVLPRNAGPDLAERRAILDEVVAFYALLPEVRQIILIGSYTDPRSDLDVYLFHTGEPPPLPVRNRFRDRVQEAGDRVHLMDGGEGMIREWGLVDGFDVRGIELYTLFRSQADAVARVDAALAGDHRRRHAVYPLGFLAGLSEGEILYDEDGLGRRLVERAADFPEGLRRYVVEEEIANVHRLLGSIERYLHRDDLLFFQDCVHNAVDSVLQALFAHHGVYLDSRKSLPRKLARLDETPVDLLDQLVFLTQQPNEGEALDTKRRLLAGLAQHLETSSRRARTPSEGGV